LDHSSDVGTARRTGRCSSFYGACSEGSRAREPDSLIARSISYRIGRARLLAREFHEDSMLWIGFRSGLRGFTAPRDEVEACRQCSTTSTIHGA
jgi:hypothetical protein